VVLIAEGKRGDAEDLGFFPEGTKPPKLGFDEKNLSGERSLRRPMLTG
jgi:hypothetical protein